MAMVLDVLVVSREAQRIDHDSVIVESFASLRAAKDSMFVVLVKYLDIFSRCFCVFECFYVGIHIYTLGIKHTIRSAIGTSSQQSNLKPVVSQKNTSRGETE